MDPYNYAVFPLDTDSAHFAGFRDHLKAGDRAPKGTLTELESGEEVRLHRQWRSGPLMLEFGSFS